MKIFGIQFGSKPAPTQTTNDKYHNFTSPFMTVGKGNLAMPFISTSYRGTNGIIRFGEDNLFPNLLRQLKYTSPLHGNIMKFINNATVGGSYEFLNVSDSAQAKVDLYKFENKINLKKLIKSITQDAIMFESIILLVTNNSDGVGQSVTRLPMDEVRWNEEMTKFEHNKDYSRGSVGVKYYDKYQYNKPNHSGILVYRMDDGDMLYPLPLYTSANNWIFLDGESSYLHKSNILNSIFASTVFKFPKKPASDEEAMEYKKTINSAKGAAEAGRSIAFFENGQDQLPIIETLPTSQNDKLFLQTDERMDSKICQAWSIDPMLMGIRVSGKLGGGSDIKQAYTIFEKNTIMPLRDEIEDVINELMDIFKVSGEFKVKNFQIIGDNIKEIKE